MLLLLIVISKIFSGSITWLDYEDCHHCVVNAWSRPTVDSSTKSFTRDIIDTKRFLLRWRKSSKCHIEEEITNIENEILSGTIRPPCWMRIGNPFGSELFKTIMRLSFARNLFIRVKERRHSSLSMGIQILVFSTTLSRCVGIRIRLPVSRTIRVTSSPLNVILKLVLRIFIKTFGPPHPHSLLIL